MMDNDEYPHNFDELISKQTNVKYIGKGKVQCDCPLGGHKTPGKHMVITDYGDHAVVKCFPRDEHDNKAFAALYGWKSLIYRHNGNGHHQHTETHKEIEEIYDYKREGKLIFQVVRINPKGFYQRRPDPLKNGEFINNLDGIEPFLFYVDDIEKAISTGETIYIPEGEKDCQTLWERGLIGTTNPMGAGKWLDSYTDSLKGARVVILQDDDKPGKEFAYQKLNFLYGKVSSLKFVELPGIEEITRLNKIKYGKEKGADITDWLNMPDHDIDELLTLVNNTPEWTPDYEVRKQLICLQSITPKDFHWFAYPYITFGKLTILEGDPGDGKSTIACALAAGHSLGANIGWARLPIGTTLLMSAEDGKADTIRPRFDKLGADLKKIYLPNDLLTLDDAGIETLESWVRTLLPSLCVIDPIVGYVGQDMNINQANQVRHVLARIALIAEKYDIAFIVIRHLTKGNNQKAIYRGSGSIDFTAAARSVLMTGIDENTGERAIMHTKCNIAPKGDSIGYRLVDGGLEWTGKSDMTYKDISTENGGALDDAKAWLEQLLMDGDQETKFIFEEGHRIHDLSPSTLKRAKKLLNIESYSKPVLGKKGAGKWYWNYPGVNKND